MYNIFKKIKSLYALVAPWYLKKFVTCNGEKEIGEAGFFCRRAARANARI